MHCLTHNKYCKYADNLGDCRKAGGCPEEDWSEDLELDTESVSDAQFVEAQRSGFAEQYEEYIANVR